MNSKRIRYALHIGFFHFLICLLLAAAVAGAVFYIWFPPPHQKLDGGLNLFLLIVSVDVVCGPFLTLVLASPSKSRGELLVDMGVVALLQISALAYGLYTLSFARPAALVFEVDRLRSIIVADIDSADMALAPKRFASLPWSGPRLLGIRAPKDAEESLRSIELSLQGIEPSMRPQWWQDYELSVPQVLAKAKAMDLLRRKHPAHSAQIDEALSSAGLTDAGSLWLPLVGRKSSEWVVLLDAKTAQPKAYLPIDGF